MSRIPSLSSREVVQALRKGGSWMPPKEVREVISLWLKGSGLPRLVIIIVTPAGPSPFSDRSSRSEKDFILSAPFASFAPSRFSPTPRA
jgi:hypothetical protein